jgi:ketosteroid isomerase-like protein
MSYSHRLPYFAIGALLAIASMSAPAVEINETARTAAAVIAVDQHWSEAENNGDAAWLEGMLLPDYRSVGVAGTFAPKASIVSHAKKNTRPQAMKQEAAAWRQAHPTETKVTMQGDTAIISFVSTSPATMGKIYSSDVFVYVDGHWHALYSQHTGLGKN